MLLELRHAREVAVCSETEKCTAACDESASRPLDRDSAGARLTNDFAGQTVVAPILAQDILKLLGSLEGLNRRDLVSRHGESCCRRRLAADAIPPKISNASTFESRVTESGDWTSDVDFGLVMHTKSEFRHCTFRPAMAQGPEL